jgi:hypothetical protein
MSYYKELDNRDDINRAQEAGLLVCIMTSAPDEWGSPYREWRMRGDGWWSYADGKWTYIEGSRWVFAVLVDD